jgi:hypothetical protein
MLAPISPFAPLKTAEPESPGAAVHSASGFPPPCVPLLFTDGDRYEWPAAGDVWERTAGSWRPVPEGGSGWLSDGEVRAQLHRSVVQWDPGHRFVPVRPWRANLPGKQLRSVEDVEGLVVDGARSAAAYVEQANQFVPLRDLVADYDEDFAYDLPARLTIPDLRQALAAILEGHAHPQVSYDPSAGRFHVRYELEPLDGWRAGYPTVEGCALTFVLAAYPADA